MLIKRYEAKTVRGDKLVIKDPAYQKGVIYGGLAFGVGWAITAACPGPIYAQIGAGAMPAIATLAGRSWWHVPLRPTETETPSLRATDPSLTDQFATTQYRPTRGAGRAML